jgi:inosose dehydratase
MKVSCHLITWGKEWEQGMDDIAELGYRACETFTGVAMQYEDRVGEFQELLAARGLRLSALYGGGRFSDPTKRDEVVDYNTRVARFLAANGVDRIVFGPAPPRAEGGTPLDELKIAAATIDEAAKRCADLGVVACVHPHLWTELQAPDEVDVIMELTDPSIVKLCIDSAHTSVSGADPAAMITRYADRLEYLHLKDVSPDREAASTDDFPMLEGNEALPIFCELGLGTVDLESVVAALRTANYEGWVTIEIDQSTRTPKESLQICRDFAQDRLGLSLSAADA